MTNDDFLDEKILKMIDQAEEPVETPTVPPTTNEDIPPEERTIYTGIKIEGKWIEFEERQFINGGITMMVPREFMDMDQEMAKIKYPMEQRPKTILSDDTGSINILFTHMDVPMAGETVASIRDRLFVMMRRVNPGIKMQSKGEETVDQSDIAYIEFTNSAIDGKLYNLMFYLELDGKPLMGNFNCLTKSMKYWKNPAFEMMRSILVNSWSE